MKGDLKNSNNSTLASGVDVNNSLPGVNVVQVNNDQIAELIDGIENINLIHSSKTLPESELAGLQTKFWIAVESTSIERLESLIEETKGLNKEELSLIFNFRHENRNAIGFIAKRYFEEDIDKPDAEKFILKICGISVFNQEVESGFISESENLTSLKILSLLSLRKLTENTEEKELASLTSDVARISLRDSSQPLAEEELEDFKTRFWDAVENISVERLELLRKEILDRKLSEIEQGLIFNSRDQGGLNAVGSMIKKYFGFKEELEKIKSDIKKIDSKFVPFLNLINKKKKDIALKQQELKGQEAILLSIKEFLLKTIPLFNQEDVTGSRRSGESFKATARSDLYFVFDIEDLHNKFWDAVESLNLEKLKTLLKEIQDRNLSDIEQSLIFNSRDKENLNAVGVLVGKYLKFELEEDIPNQEKIKELILMVCSISEFNQQDGIGNLESILSDLKISQDITSQDITSQDILNDLFGLEDFKTRFCDSVENINIEKFEALMQQLNEHQYKNLLNLVLSSTNDVGKNAIDILFDKYVNQDLTSTDKEKIVKIICDIFNMISRKREFEITLMNRFNTLSLDQKISIFLGVLFHTNYINLLDILIEEIKRLDTQQKSQILNTRFIFDAEFVPEVLILNTNQRKFSDYVGINILGKLFIDFINVEKNITEKQIHISQEELEQIPALIDIFKILFGYIKKIIKIPEFNINEYVIRGSWQDIRVINTERSVLNEYSGMNILHLSIFENKRELFDCLLDRNNSLQDRNNRNHDLYVNFEYPMAHPEYHMVSPSKLYEEKNIDWEEYGYRFQEHDFREYYPDNWSDSSGDSDSTNSRAFKYKKWLKELVVEPNQNLVDEFSSKYTTPSKAKLIMNLNDLNQNSESSELNLNIADKIEKLSIAHYHGLPFMKGVYSSSQQFAIAEQIVELCNKKTKTEKDGDKFKLLMSRTLMTSMGIENINMTLKHKENPTFKEATSEVDDKLIKIMKKSADFINGINGVVILRELLAIFVKASTRNRDKQNTQHKRFWDTAISVADYDSIDSKSISKYRFPFLSTSKQPDHSLKYGFGWHLEADRGERPIDPGYRGVKLNERQPRHRLAGFLFVIRMNLPRYLDLVEQGKILDTVGLHHQSLIPSIDLNKNSKKDKNYQGGLGRDANQLEVTFLDCIELRDIVAAIPLVYPNYSKGFNEDWHQKVLFYNDEDYKHYRNKKSAELQNKIKQPESQSEKESESTTLTYLAGIKNTYTHIALNIAEYRDYDGSRSVQITPDNQLVDINHEFTISTERQNYPKRDFSPGQKSMSDISAPKSNNSQLRHSHPYNNSPIFISYSNEKISTSRRSALASNQIVSDGDEHRIEALVSQSQGHQRSSSPVAGGGPAELHINSAIHVSQSLFSESATSVVSRLDDNVNGSVVDNAEAKTSPGL